MAGSSVTETYKSYGGDKQNLPKMVVADLAWVADDADGSVPATALSTALMKLITGFFLFEMITVPGTPSPTANYDITLVGAVTGLDMLGGAGANRHTTSVEQALPVIGATVVKRPILEGMTFTLINNIVNSAEGAATLVFLRDS